MFENQIFFNIATEGMMERYGSRGNDYKWIETS